MVEGVVNSCARILSETDGGGEVLILGSRVALVFGPGHSPTGPRPRHRPASEIVFE